jgi:hypothetical protein
MFAAAVIGLVVDRLRGAGASDSAGCGECLEALEPVEDCVGPGPVGGEVERTAAGVAGQLPGDVQDPVAQPFGLADRCSPSRHNSWVQTMTSCAISASSNHAALASKLWKGR